MGKKFIRFFILIFTISCILATQNETMAQDTGDAALRSLAIYTLAGGGGGVVLGFARWFLDPLDPDIDFGQTLLQGFGVGVFVGFAFGVMQLNKQAVFPYEEPMIEDEFKGNAFYLPPSPNQYRFDYGKANPPLVSTGNQVDFDGRERDKKRHQSVTIFNFEYRF